MADKSITEVIARVTSLTALAVDDSTTEPERRNAALQAITLINSNDLVVVPRAELDAAKTAVEGANAMVARSRKKETQNLMLGGVLGWLAKGRF
jgi:multidrug resistance efflux pump